MLFGVALLTVGLVGLFSPLTPFTQTQLLAERVTIVTAADRINTRSSEGFTLQDRIQDGGVMVLVFNRRLPWYLR